MAESPAWHYLEGRGIRPSGLDVIRFSAAVWHPYARCEMPAMVARIEHPKIMRGGSLAGAFVICLRTIPGNGRKSDKFE